ncbi:MAG: hypothetical protein QM479_14265 [Pseudomonadota bacterium]
MHTSIKKNKGLGFIIFIALILSGCGSVPKLKQGHEIVPPEPIYGNSGEFMSPYTEDEVLADWVDKAINAKAGAQVGAAVGAYAGAKALEMVPFVGGMIGKYAGEQIGRQIAISASGGMEYITSSSDLSFNSLDKLSVYLYAKFSTHAHYQDALAATMEIYPDLKKIYQSAIYKASAEAPDAAQVAKIRKQQKQQQFSEESEESEDTEVTTVRLLQSDGSVIETQSQPQPELQIEQQQAHQQEKENNTATIDNESTVKINQQAEPQSPAIATTKSAQPVSNTAATIISESVVVEPSIEKEKVEIETTTDVNEAVNHSDRSGSYGTTTSKITTITTIKTVTTPGKRTIIYREVQK